MRTLSICLALLGLAALVQGLIDPDHAGALFGVVVLLCAATTFGARGISTFLKIFVGIFSIETIVFGVPVLADRFGLWPAGLALLTLGVGNKPFQSVPLTEAIFSIVVYLLARSNMVGQVMHIADRYFNADTVGRAQIWPFRPFTALECRIAVALVVALVLMNQVQVGVVVRINFFNRDIFNAFQQGDASAFWHQLLFVFTPWLFVYVNITVLNFFVKSMLIIRWRRWLTEHFVARWLSHHNHYRISLVAGQTDNPDQRIAEDVFRFINGGSDGSITAYGLYDFSIILIATATSLVSFSVVLWYESSTFMLPGTDIAVPGFLFWVGLIYAGLATIVTHWIGRPLIQLYFTRQHMEADFRFSLARLREYTEQVALLDGEAAEQGMAGRTFGALIANYLALVFCRVRVTAFTEMFGELTPVIPYVVTAPFYFAGKIKLGAMTQTAGAFDRVASALSFFVNYYTYLAGFKSVVDRLISFDAEIDQAQAISTAGPSRIATATSSGLTIDEVKLSLPDGRPIVEMHHVELARGQSVVLSGPSGSGKSTVFRTIAGVWPYGNGRIVMPETARVMVVPARPYIPISTLRAAVSYPAPADAYADDAIRSSLVDAHLANLVNQLDLEDVWSQRLSSGEQQRLAIARALLKQPGWLFLDEATSAVDEKLQAELYATLARRLPNTTVVSISHRSTAFQLHQRHLEMVPEGDHFTVRDVVQAAAAE